MFDRRQFLIGAAGSLLTTAFVRKAKIFSLRNYEPLLTPPGRLRRSRPGRAGVPRALAMHRPGSHPHSVGRRRDHVVGPVRRRS